MCSIVPQAESQARQPRRKYRAVSASRSLLRHESAKRRISRRWLSELFSRRSRPRPFFNEIRLTSSQFNPNIAHHWAHDLGINGRFEDWAPEYGWWLEKRIRTMEGFATPTGAVVRRP